MTEIMKSIDNAFHYVSTMSVNGQNQDLAFAAKEELRKAYKQLEQIEQQSNQKSSSMILEDKEIIPNNGR